MPFYDQVLQSLSSYQALRTAVEKERLPVGVTGLSHIVKAHLIHTLCTDTSTRGLVIVSDEGEAVRLQEDLAQMGSEAYVYVARDFTFRSVEGHSKEYEHQRLSVLSKMLEGEYQQIIVCVDALCQYTVPPDQLLQRTFSLQVGQTIELSEVIRRLSAAGYVRADQVEGPGQFAQRGGILDFFPPDLPQPVRLEFWGDEIDSLACFDTLTQRRIDSLKAVRVPPAAEVLFPSAEELARRIELHCADLKSAAQKEAKQILLADAARLRAGDVLEGMDRFVPLMAQKPCTLLDYAEDALLFVSETAKVREKARVSSWQLSEDVKALLEAHVLCAGLTEFMMPWQQLTGEFSQRGAVFLDSFVHKSYDVPVKELLALQSRQFSPWSGGVEQLAEDLASMLRQGYACTVLAGGERSAKLLAEDLRAHQIPADFVSAPDALPAGKVTVTPGSLSAGFEYPQAKFQLLTHGQAIAAAKRTKRKKSANTYHSLDELHRGDYVVHATHGIGIFAGINKLDVQGVAKDYIQINYAGGDTLYVPVTQLDLVSKYIGASSEEAKVKLHKLGSSEWQKTKRRVKSAVKDMAKQLIRLYAERMHTQGYAFAPDSDLQNDFERRFEFDETDDQLRCIDEIKYDMERPVPMDRLLCGDVGFGKTEVALRAAFKCISEGKQCALLVPTTILAWQHYQTILHRMEGIPVTVDLLNRFRTTKQQEETIRKLRSGEVDMVVGTHRLLSKDIVFHDLGLVIVDEEQRFGVAQKEKLKELFKNVDVLTLSATPIPRTLNMAMSGLRDMSIIEEAPQDRHPVQTYVLEYDAGILADAIRREIRRGGQVYYLHNRVDSIQRIASTWQQRIPEARVGIAHGKMSEEELSDVWRQLLDNEIDLLVCTTIIETGVDVPNCNTLIIEDADRMGLAQLHQIRGRVGRSSRRAYAYLTFRPGKALSDTATKRLDAVREFTEFGSGLKIAMRDLEIRGAGNLLGAEQHGQMESVGYDMYLKLLADAVKEEKGEQPAPENECMVDVQVQAHIPESYIPQLQQRLGVYRRIADIRSQEDSFDVLDELIDRFGEPPASVKGLIDVALLRNTASALGISEVVQKNGSMLLYQNPLNMERAGVLAGALRGRVLVSAGQRPYIAVKMLKNQTPIEALREALDAMQD